MKLAAGFYLHICLFLAGDVSPVGNIENIEINKESQNSRIGEVDTVPIVLWSCDVLGEEAARIKHLVDHLWPPLWGEGNSGRLLRLEGLARLELLRLLRLSLERLECLLLRLQDFCWPRSSREGSE